jgi:hypothetical protein
MSQLQVTTFEANTLSANVITSGQTTVNSTGLYLSNSGGVINSSAISVTNSTSGITALAPTISAPGISIGGAFYTTLPNETVNTQIFTANGTWVKPTWANTGNELVITHLWGGGGGGVSNNSTSAGGGGGAFVFGYFKTSQCNSVCNVVVGNAGVGLDSGASAITAGGVGGTSIFYANTTNSLSAYGGGGGNANSTFGGAGGGGGGWLSAGQSNTNRGFALGGSPLGGNNTSTSSTFGGASQANDTAIGASIYGGGAGSAGADVKGDSIYGGGGGAWFNSAVGPGTSFFGGFGGGNGSSNSTLIVGQIPAGGGGPGANGARGEVRVYTLRYTGP